uniref:Putative acyl-coa-binding domain-containing protein n=1 Tax=Ornithodoros turicata TaxID=34597 RepID=A0A2R5L819_9ACAR
MTTEEKFHAAVEVIRGLPKNGSFQPSHDLQLKFYAYYKQATQGPVAECKVPKPRFWDIVGNAKWDAWMKLGDMSKEEAMQKYVEELVKIVEAMSYTENVAKFMDLLGPLFEGMPQKDEFLTRLNGNRESEDDIETLDVPEEESHTCTKAVNGAQDKKAAGNSQVPVNGHESSYESEEEFSDTYDHMGEDDGDSASPLPEASSIENTVGEALQNGTERVLVHENDSQLWAFYAEKKKVNGDLPNARGGGDERQQRSGGPLGGVPPGGGRHNRGYRRRDGDIAADNVPAMPGAPNRYYYAGGGGNSGGGSGGRRHLPMEVSEQLAIAVLRLQHTMDEVVARLEALETLLQQSKAQQNQHWWLFGNIPPHILLVILSWPIALQIGLYILRRRSHRRGLH